MRCGFSPAEGCEGEKSLAYFEMQRFDKRGTVKCCAACWRSLVGGHSEPEEHKPQRIEVPQAPKKHMKPVEQMGLRRVVVAEKKRMRITEDDFG